jgi:hypothetical protein
MAFMLKIRLDIKKDKVADFKSNQMALCKVMLDHPGVICYYVDYPTEVVSEWVEIYANDDTFRAHLANGRATGRWAPSSLTAIRSPAAASETPTRPRVRF